VLCVVSGIDGGRGRTPSDTSNELGSTNPPPILTFLPANSSRSSSSFHLPRAGLSSWPRDTERFRTHHIRYHFGTPPRGTPCPPRLRVMRPTSAPPGKKSPALHRIEASSSIVGDPLASPTLPGSLSSGLPLMETC
jgi:hypothetical protein